MRIIIFLSLLFLISPVFTLESSLQENFSSRLAVSQAGRFSVLYSSPLMMDKKESLKLTNFIAYQDIFDKHSVFIGAIPGEDELSSICKNPVFLENEKIEHISSLNNRDIHYFISDRYKGCVVYLNKNISVLIAETPKPFVNQAGEKIRHIGIVGQADNINKLKYKIYFDIAAQDYFFNLLQISQTFSPFANDVDWNLIKSEGMKFIGNETETCRGLSAAAKFLLPELIKKDFHSFITMHGLGSSFCPASSIKEDEDMKKWFAIPEETRNKIVKYIGKFHGYELDQHIAYLLVPAIETYDPAIINEKITEGRNELNHANINNACGIIVDLRFNIGGNNVPMILTLSSLLFSGKLFNLDQFTPIYLSEDKNKLFVNNSHDIYGKYDGNTLNKNISISVAILTNWMTSSSGSITSLVLRDNTSPVRVFGSKTSATTSVNAAFYLLDGNVLNLTVDRIYHKNGNRVPLRLPVDEEIPDENPEIIFSSTDNALITAKIIIHPA